MSDWEPGQAVAMTPNSFLTILPSSSLKPECLCLLVDTSSVQGETYALISSLHSQQQLRVSFHLNGKPFSVFTSR